ncbi:DUF4112 domain-containing protein [Mesorhizobium loti]|uniref:DUF4112 domain-containing protein n=1 Tax=Rhizobium loti TaxID=381 RepID=UPI000688C1DA|nr:DUF4112 domain-containing protein [Mesorhizobium loti]
MAHTASWTIGDASDLRARVERLDRLSRLLDVAFAIPGTKVRFGVDAILGLIPVVGDWAGVALSSIIVVEAFRIGVPVSVLIRMIANVVIEGVIGSIPIAGDAFDVFWRANRRNMSLLIRHLERERRI